MAKYQKSRQQVDRALRHGGVVVIMNKKHARKPEDLISTMWEIYQMGYVAECTFRIDPGLIKEAMPELVRKRAESPADNPFLLGVGSIINPGELELALDLDFDLIVAPANVMGGYGEGKEFVQRCHQAEVFCVPAVFTPTELQYFIERPDGLEPDAVKIFPAGTHGPEGVKGMLNPFARDRHAGRMIIATGGVDYTNGPKYQEAILGNGFFPVLGMSSPLAGVEKEGKPGDLHTIGQSLTEFKRKFQPYRPTR